MDKTIYRSKKRIDKKKLFHFTIVLGFVAIAVLESRFHGIYSLLMKHADSAAFGKIWKENMIKMQNMAGIDMIPDLQYRFLMKIMMFCDIMYFMPSW